MQLAIHNLNKRFGDTPVLEQINLQVEAGQIACLLGASGCGKTTLLRCVAGFETIDAGQIVLDGVVVSDPHVMTPPQDRAVGMVFQDHALFPHLTVAQNVAFGLHQWARSARLIRVTEVLELVGLETMADQFPHQLSGGQQQRAALARAIATNPRLILMDEPFASLDRDLRHRLAPDIVRILKQSSTTALWVTHDQKEAMNIADVIGVMKQGHIVQWETPPRLYHQPASRFVAEFLGECSFLDGRIGLDGRVNTTLGDLNLQPGGKLSAGTAVDVLVRPDQLVVDDQKGLDARILTSEFHGVDILYELQLPNAERIKLLLSSTMTCDVGEQVRVRWSNADALVFGKE